MAEPRSAFEPEPFGKYVLVDHVATGGMAEIYKAKRFGHGGFESLLVIKRILPHIGAKADFVEMFTDEAKISVALQHPNIVRVFDFGKAAAPDPKGGTNDSFFIAMECVDGKDVRQLLKQLARRRRFLPERFAAFVAFEAAKGLHYAHMKTDLEGQLYEVVHRDVSPSNILVSYEGEVKVVDFGIAKAESNAYTTRDGMLKGKFEYMSPEQATGGDVDRRSDVFSLGIVLYEMLTSRRLFKTGSDTETLKLIRDQDVAPPNVVRPEVPAALSRIAVKALNRDRDQRYPTAQAMAEDLREYLFPASTDTLREELSAFMEELFREEKLEERERLRICSELAVELSEQASWDWDGSATMSRTQTTVRIVGSTVVGGVAVAALLLALIGATAWFYQDEVRSYLGVQQVATRGSLDVLVVPDARVWVDGELVGSGGTVRVDDLAPGVYSLRLEADGHRSLEKTVQVAAGDVVRIAEQLEASGLEEPAPAEVPQVTPEPGGTDTEPEPSGPPVLRLRSVPSGAEVLVNGEGVGATPTTFRGTEGASYDVQMRLEGYQTASEKVSGLSDGARRTVSLTLEEAPSAGTLTVVLLGGGWANVFVDGKKLAKTAPLRNVEVAAGPHEVRLVNEAAGIDEVRTIEVAPGAETTLRITND